MTMPQASLPSSATSLFGTQPQLDPNSALAQAQMAQAATLAGMQQHPNYPIGGIAGVPQMNQAPVGGSAPTSGSMLTPDVLKRYIAKEGIGSPAQAAQIALLAWQNGDIAVAQFASKIATNYSISKLIAGQDGDANSISWTDLGKLAKGKSAIGREDIGAAPDLTEALESDLRAMAGLAPGGASQQNQWDPYATSTTSVGMGGGQQQQGQYPMQGQPATMNGVSGNIVMMPYGQAQQVQQNQQGTILPQQQPSGGLTPLQQSIQFAGVANIMPLVQQAGLAGAAAGGQQQSITPIPAAIGQPISYGNMLPQQASTGMQPQYPQQQQGSVAQQQAYPQQQQMANMPVTLPGSYRLALIPTF